MRKIAYAVSAVCLLLSISLLAWGAASVKTSKNTNNQKRDTAPVAEGSSPASTAKTSSDLPPEVKDKNSQPSSKEAAPQTKDYSISSVTEAAVKSGVLTCARRIEQVVKFLTNGTQESGALLFLPQGNPDEGAFSVSLELDGPAGTTAYAAASFYPDKAGGCSASYDLVEYSDKPCTYFKAAPSDKKEVSPSLLKRDISVIGLGNVKVLLMPSGRGCTVIKKEVIN